MVRVTPRPGWAGFPAFQACGTQQGCVPGLGGGAGLGDGFCHMSYLSGSDVCHLQAVCMKACDPSELSCPLLDDEQRWGWRAAPSACGPEWGEVLGHSPADPS